MLKPVNGFILAKCVEDEKKGSLILLNEEKFKTMFNVIDTADDVEIIPCGCKIIIQKYQNMDFDFEGETYSLIHQDKVLAIVEDEPAPGEVNCLCTDC